jgi:hypothetical protein
VGNEIRHLFTEDGDSTIEVRSYSVDGLRKGSCSKRVSVMKREIPAVTCPGITNNQRPTWTWNALAEAFAYRCSFTNGEPWVYLNENANSFKPDDDINDGLYILYVQEQNKHGIWSGPGYCGTTIDTVPPAPPVINVVPGDYYTAQSLSIISDQYNLYSLNDGEDWNSGTSASLNVGYRYTIRARHRDEAGNFSEAGPVVG